MNGSREIQPNIDSYVKRTELLRSNAWSRGVDAGFFFGLSFIEMHDLAMNGVNYTYSFFNAENLVASTLFLLGAYNAYRGLVSSAKWFSAKRLENSESGEKK